MRLRTNEVCPIHRSVSCCGREIRSKPKLVRLSTREWRTRIIREATGNYGHRPRCGNC